MDKREALQAVKEAKRQYQLWAGRVEAVVAGAVVQGEGVLAGGFGRWYSRMEKELHHFEEYHAIQTPHEEAQELFRQLQEMIASAGGKGWASRWRALGGWGGKEPSPEGLLDSFKNHAARVIDHLNQLERRLLVTRSAEWEARQNGTWGQPGPREIKPADWATITQH